MFKSLIFLLWIGMHPVHVAFISMEYSAGAGGIKALVKIYSDDFILDYNLFSMGDHYMDLSTKNKDTKEKISNYLNDRLEFYTGSKKIKGFVQDYESSDGELKVNINYQTGKKPKIFRVKCRIMTEIYSDQANFLIFRYNDYEKGIKLTPEIQEQLFEIK